VIHPDSEDNNIVKGDNDDYSEQTYYQIFQTVLRIMHIAMRAKTLAMMVDVQVGIMDGETTNATSAMMVMTTAMMPTITGVTTMVIRND